MHVTVLIIRGPTIVLLELWRYFHKPEHVPARLNRFACLSICNCALRLITSSYERSAHSLRLSGHRAELQFCGPHDTFVPGY